MSRTLYWITNDLRIRDNPALNNAFSSDAFLPVYIRDTSEPTIAQGAAAWWLHQSLSNLARSYDDLGFKLHFFHSDTLSTLETLCEQHQITHVVCSRAYTPYQRSIQKKLSTWCAAAKIKFTRFASSLLSEPEYIQNKQGGYYRVYTPFSKRYLLEDVRQPVKLVTSNNTQSIVSSSSSLEDLDLCTKKNWADDFYDIWQTGEDAALSCLADVIQNKIEGYDETRNMLGMDGTSKLSAHLRFGEITPAQIWQETNQVLSREQATSYLRQLVWRDFNHHLLFHQPTLIDSCFNKKFDAFPWRKDNHQLALWQKGLTGYPVVDAAMNQLWKTGWMHNRARMIVASFLTKHLLISWQEGANWFWDTLVDADLANNIGGWQWTAGCGADAAPYFRVFNPITQGEKFDPEGHYTRHWLPQLSSLPKKYLFKPWEAPANELRKCGVSIGDNYPSPIVEHKEARQRALDAYEHIKSPK